MGFFSLFQKRNENGFPNITDDFSVVFVADTHGKLTRDELSELKKVDLKPISALVCLGDVSDDDIQKLRDACLFSKENSFVFGVLGNHDAYGDLKRRGITSLDDGIVDICGVTFGGFSGSLKYKNADAPLLTDKESVEKARMLPSVDVLVTHDGPKIETRNEAHAGLLGVRTYLEEKHPKYHFFGHRHERKEEKLKSTTSICEYRLSVYHFSKNGATLKWSSVSTYETYIHNLMRDL